MRHNASRKVEGQGYSALPPPRRRFSWPFRLSVFAKRECRKACRQRIFLVLEGRRGSFSGPVAFQSRGSSRSRCLYSPANGRYAENGLSAKLLVVELWGL